LKEVSIELFVLPATLSKHDTPYQLKPQTVALGKYKSNNNIGYYPLPRDITNIGVKIPDSTRSDESIAHVKVWLNACINSHSKCNRGAKAALPTRIIDVRPVGGQDIVRLCEGAGRCDHYICLSHCWGRTKPPIVTTQYNLEAHKIEIPVQSLSKVFQDAIEFTRKLDIRFLWIDSICIVQDDKDDWRREAAKMAQVYRDSLLTLAATDSSDGTQGLFRTPGLEITGVQVGNQTSHQIFARRELKHNPHLFLPLLRRAWVYQERILSPRVLNFSTVELVWECISTTECQCRKFKFVKKPYSGLVDAYGKEVWDKEGKIPMFKAQHRSKMSNKEIDWRNMASSYSMLRLTYCTDRLVAFSGIAKEFQARRSGDQYLAGIWKSSVIGDLCWIVNPSSPCNPRLEPWCAPTWSWASINVEGVRWLPDVVNIVPKARLLSAACIPEGEDSTGQLMSGKLVVSATMAPGIIRHRNSTIVHHASSVVPVEFTIYTLEISGTDLKADVRPDYALYMQGKAHIASGEHVYCMHLCDTKITDPQGSFIGGYLLILREVTGHPSVFERIGIVHLRRYSSLPERYSWNRKEVTII
jgi:hypothetical protein